MQFLLLFINKEICKLHENLAIKNNEEIYKWISKIDIFSNLNSKTLYNLQAAVNITYPIRNQVIIKEGSPIQYIYIISKGEFELTKSIKVIDDNKENLNVSKDHNFYDSSNIITSQRKTYYKDFYNSTKSKGIRKSIMILGEGNILCAVDYYFNRNSTFTITWKSFEGILYRIKVEDFKRIVLNSEYYESKFKTFWESKDKENTIRLEKFYS